MHTLRMLDAPKVWLKNWTEAELETVIPAVVASTEEYDSFILVSDDVIVSQSAYDAVKKGLTLWPIVTGYCNLDISSTETSLTASPPKEPYATVECYDWVDFRDIPEDDYFPTYHPSFAMTGMTRLMMENYPWKCYGGTPGGPGWAADLSLSIRLHAAGIVPMAVRKAFIYHTKRDWKEIDHFANPARRLLVGVETAKVEWDV